MPVEKRAIKKIVNFILIKLIAFVGEHAIDSYYSSPTQWSNKSISDVVYLALTDDLPPIIIEIQHTVDVDFYLRLISYGVSAARQYNTPPILITFAISSMKYEVSKRTVSQTSKPFLWKIQHCQPWARCCYFVTIDSIRQSLTEEPLDKFVGLSIFLISQHRSLAANPYYLDPTIQKLYTIAKQIFENQATKRQTEVIEDLVYVCDEIKKKLKEAIVALDQSEVPETVKNPVKNCIEGAILINNTYQAKYEESDCLSILSSRPSSPDVGTGLLSGDVPASLSNPPIEVPNTTPAQIVRSRSENWEYINSHLSTLGEKEAIPWEAIYVNSRRNGYFSTFGNSASL